MAKKKITAEKLKQVLVYEPLIGVFFWKNQRMQRRLNSNIAGAVTTGGYQQIQIDGCIYKSHRLAWLYMTGKMPSLEVDHINGNPSDNRWKNLREVDSSVNKENRRVPRKDNGSGLIGAHYHKKYGWRSSIRVKGVTIHLGYFDSAEAAHSAYITKKREVHDGCTI